MKSTLFVLGLLAFAQYSSSTLGLKSAVAIKEKSSVDAVSEHQATGTSGDATRKAQIHGESKKGQKKGPKYNYKPPPHSKHKHH